MHITRSGGHVTLRDRIAPYWLLGGFLLAGGVLAVAMPLGLATNAGDLEPWQRLASMGIGLGGIAATVWWLVRSPATIVRLDLFTRRLRVVRLGLDGRHVRQLAFEELESVEIEQGSDDDGGKVWSPIVRLRSGERLLLSQLLSHDEAGVRNAVTVVAEACRLRAR